MRAPPKQYDFDAPVLIAALEVDRQSVGEMTLEGAWVLESENDLFGGWSAMVEWIDDRLLLGSDSGRMMTIGKPDRAPAMPILAVLDRPVRDDKRQNDLEDLARDPNTNDVWASFERSNEIVRIRRPLIVAESFAPAAMAEWPANAGAESLVRFADGRMIAIAETAISDGRHEAVLFPAGPGNGREPVRFLLEADEDYRPAGATELPDGRMLIVLRKLEWAVPPRFAARLVIADPRAIRPGRALATQVVAKIEDPLPTDNYEGVAVAREADGGWTVWLVSDDNNMRYQRTILLKLGWETDGNGKRQKARE